MKLLPIVGIDGYVVDCKNHVCYSLKRNRFKPLRVCKPYNLVSIYHDGTTHHYPLARLEYCAKMGINPNKLSFNNVVMRDQKGNTYLTDRYEVARNIASNKRNSRMSIEEIQKNLDCIKKFRKGDKRPFFLLVEREAERVRQFFLNHKNRNPTVVEVIVEKATIRLMEETEAGAVFVNPYNYIKKCAYGFLEKERKHRK